MLDISKFKTPLKKLYLKATFTDHYHYNERREAERAIAVIEQYNDAKFTPQLKKIADEYAIEVLGGKEYAPWLYVYSLIYGKFVEGWIPDNFYGTYVRRKVNKELSVIGEFKTLTNAVLHTPLLPDIAHYIDGIFYTRELHQATALQIRALLADYAHVFVKKDYSYRGIGVVKLATQNFNEAFFKAFGNCVIQAPIKQHAFFDEFMSESVASIRVFTVKDLQGNITARTPHLKLARSGESHVSGDEEIMIPLWVDKGSQLGEFGYGAYWRRWSAHPDTGVTFSGKVVPHAQQLLQDCVALHARVPHLSFIGWDAIVDHNNQTKIIEWNTGHPGIILVQATRGAIFKDLNWERFRE